MTLEERLGAKQKRAMQGRIIEGWLQDKVIGAYLYKICFGKSDVKYCEAALALHLVKERNVYVRTKFIPFHTSIHY